MEKLMEAWTGGLFRAVFLSVFGVSVCALGVWLGSRLDGWQRWAMVVLAGVGVILVLAGLAAFVDRINNPWKS
jgi:hypothetical protein